MKNKSNIWRVLGYLIIGVVLVGLAASAFLSLYAAIMDEMATERADSVVAVMEESAAAQEESWYVGAEIGCIVGLSFLLDEVNAGEKSPIELDVAGMCNDLVEEGRNLDVYKDYLDGLVAPGVDG